MSDLSVEIPQYLEKDRKEPELFLYPTLTSSPEHPELNPLIEDFRVWVEGVRVLQAGAESYLKITTGTDSNILEVVPSTSRLSGKKLKQKFQELGQSTAVEVEPKLNLLQNTVFLMTSLTHTFKEYIGEEISIDQMNQARENIAKADELETGVPTEISPVSRVTPEMILETRKQLVERLKHRSKRMLGNTLDGMPNNPKGIKEIPDYMYFSRMISESVTQNHDLKFPFVIIAGYNQLLPKVKNMNSYQNYYGEIYQGFRDIFGHAHRVCERVVEDLFPQEELKLEKVISHMKQKIAAHLSIIGIKDSLPVGFSDLLKSLDPEKVRVNWSIALIWDLMDNIGRNYGQHAFKDFSGEKSVKLFVDISPDQKNLLFTFTDNGRGFPEELVSAGRYTGLTTEGEGKGMEGQTRILKDKYGADLTIGNNNPGGVQTLILPLIR